MVTAIARIFLSPRSIMPKRSGLDPETALLHLVRQVRTEAGLRQQDLAERLGQAQSFVSKYERGDRRLDVVELRSICLACNVTFADFARRFERLLAE